MDGTLPSTRPVVSGTSCIWLSMSKLLLLSDILENIADPVELISSEHLLLRISAFNKESGDIVLSACDVIQLFPSLKAESG